MIVLVVNAKNDRETEGYTAADFVKSIVGTLNASYQQPIYGLGNVSTTYPVSAFITDLVHLKKSEVPVDVDEITTLGIRCTVLGGEFEHATNYSAEMVRHAVRQVLSAHVD